MHRYVRVVAEVALSIVYRVFDADTNGHIETVVFNGYFDTSEANDDPHERYLVSVEVTRSMLDRLQLARADPVACLRSFNAVISESLIPSERHEASESDHGVGIPEEDPTKLVPVTPIIDIAALDHVCIETPDVLSMLDQRENIMDLSVQAWAHLIAHLYEAMGWQVHQTQISADGSVTCVAIDPQVGEGKTVLIWARRDQNTVQVDTVQSFLDMLHQAQAAKGIIVVTSGFSDEARALSAGKSLDLVRGVELLSLLHDHARLDMLIEHHHDRIAQQTY